MTESKVVKSLFTGGAIIFIGLLISKMFGLLYRVIVGRTLGPEEYGIISVMLAVSSVIGALAYIGIPNGVQKYVSEYRGKNDVESQVGVLRTGLILVTLPSIITGLALFLLAPWLSIEVFNEPRAIWPLRFLALILPLRAWRKTMIKTTEAYEKMQYRVYTNYIYGNVLKVMLTIALVTTGYGYLGAAFAYAFAWGSAIMLAAIFTYKVLPESFQLSKSPGTQYRKLLHHSWPLFAAGLFASIAGYIDTFMLQAFLGSEEVGLYNAAYPFAAAITFAGSAFASIYLSNASKLYGKGKKQEMAEAYRLVVKWIAIVSLPMFMIMTAFSEAVLQVFGSEYLGMDNVLRVLALGFLLSTAIGPVSKVIQAVDKTRYKLYLALFIGTSNIILNYLLIPVYGIMGAAYATTLTFGIAFILKLGMVKHLTGYQPFRPVLLKIITSSGLAALTVLLISQLAFETTPLWYLIIGLPIYGIIYAALTLVTRTIEEEDLTILKYISESTDLKSEKIEKIIRRYSQ